MKAGMAEFIPSLERQGSKENNRKMTMSDKQDIGPQKRPASTAQIVAQQKSVANELRSGSPLEPVVQGRAESPVPLSLDVQGTPLLPCPFCGSEAVDDENDNTGETVFAVYCSYCNASYESFTSMKRAIQGWNNRVGNQQHSTRYDIG